MRDEASRRLEEIVDTRCDGVHRLYLAIARIERTPSQALGELRFELSQLLRPDVVHLDPGASLPDGDEPE